MYDYERVKSSSRSIDGIKFMTKKREFMNCNTLLAEAGTTGYKGIDSGHGARTFFSIKDTCCSDIDTNIIEGECGTGFEVRINGDTGLGEIGSRLQKKYSDFDVRNYGYRLLSTFIEDMDNFKLKKKNSTVIVKVREDNTLRDEVTNYIIETVEKAVNDGVELGIIGRKLRGRYPDFNVREFGYSTLSRFISGIKELRINSTDNNSKNVCLYVTLKKNGRS